MRVNYSRWHGFYTTRKLRDSFSCKYFRQLNIYTDNFENWNKFIYSVKNMACYWSWRKIYFIYFCLWTSSLYYLKYLCAEGGENAHSFVCQNQGTEHMIKLFKTFVRGRYVLYAGKKKKKTKLLLLKFLLWHFTFKVFLIYKDIGISNNRSQELNVLWLILHTESVI